MNRFILLDEDHQLLTKALNNDPQFATLEEKEKESIKAKLSGAELVNAYQFPNNVSRLYDVITIRNIISRQNVQYEIVPPAEKDDWNGKISAISPLGISLMGVVKGQSIVWQSGKKKNYYAVVEVRNAMYI